MKILIGMPLANGQGVHPQVVKNLIEFDLGRQALKHDLSVAFPQGSILSWNRNQSVSKAMLEDKDWLLFWDSDVEILEKGFFGKMIKTAYDFAAPIVGLPVRLRDGKTFNFAYKTEKEYVNYIHVPSKSTEVDVIGTGVMLINVHWLKEHWPKSPYFHIIDTETGFWPEDWNFCEEVKKRGGKIMMCPIKTRHWGLQAYSW